MSTNNQQTEHKYLQTALNRREVETIKNLAEVLIDGENVVLTKEEIAWNVIDILLRMDTSRILTLRLMLIGLEYIYPILTTGKRFSKLSLDARKKFVSKRLASPNIRGPLRDLAKIKAIFLSAYYSDPRVFESIGFVPVKERARFATTSLEPKPRPPLNLTEPMEDVLETDVLVIGSGAGGAVVAYNAAKQGKRVVLIEEGSYVPVSEIKHDEAQMTSQLYKEGGIQYTVDFDMALLQGKTLGGTTVVNNAICFKLNDETMLNPESPDVYERWEQLGAHIDKSKLDEAYVRVEEMIGVDSLNEEIAGNNADILLDGWAELVQQDLADPAHRAGLFNKNYDDCLGCGYCNFGCKYSRKLSMLETYIPKAIEHGAKIVTNCHAVKIMHQGKRATGVLCELGPNKRALTINAKSVVISCGAIGSSVLLMKSGVNNSLWSGKAGNHFSFNAATFMMAKFPQPLNSFDGVQMAAYVDNTRFMLETLFNPPMTFAVALPGWFDTHFNRMLDYNRFALVGVVVGTQSNARVKRSSFFRKAIGPVKYSMADEDLASIKAGLVQLAKALFEAGAESVYPATFEDIEMKASEYKGQDQKIERLINTKIGRSEDLTLTTAHPQGGNIMSDNPRLGVVDSQFRVHGYENLFICDASVFPTSIRINPQLTIMAMADYFSNLDVL